MQKTKKATITALLVLGLLIATVPLFSLTFAASDPPIHLHLTWQENDMSTTMTVTWQTTNSTSGNTVRYGSQSGVYSFSKDGEVYAGGSGYIHNVELTALSPGTIYYFVCGGTTGGWSTERKFRTAPTNPTSVRFISAGDARSNPSARDQVSSTMRTFDPSFVLFNGDAVNIGSNQSEWDNFFDSLDALWIDSNNFTIPIIPCLGNHEMYGPANYTQTNYYQQFALPGNEQWFSLNWGNLLHIIVLNSQANITGDQLAWLAQDLAASKNYTWKIAMFHQPIYTTGQDPARPDEGVAWCPLFEQYHVQVVVCGHNHMYERFKPIYNNSTVPSYGSATMYITAGGWGAPLYPVGNSSWLAPWLAYAKSTYSFTVMDAFSNGTLNFRAVDTQKQIMDQLALTATDALLAKPALAASAFCNVTVLAGWTWNFFAQSIGGIGTFTYQWYEGFTPIAGQTSTVLSVTKNTPGTYAYYCAVTDSQTTVYSNTVTLTVMG